MRIVSSLVIAMAFACAPEKDKNNGSKEASEKTREAPPEAEDFRAPPTETASFAEDLFLTEADFQTPAGMQVVSVDKEFMTSMVRSEVYRLESINWQPSAEEEQKEAQSERPAPQYQISASGSKMILKTPDVGFKKIRDEAPLGGQEGTETVEQSEQTLFAIDCLGQDLSRFDGMSAEEFTKANFEPEKDCKDGYGVQSQLKFRTKTIRTYKPFDPESIYSQNRDSYSAFFVSSQESEDGGPCYYMPNSVGEFKGSCVFKDLSYADSFEALGQKKNETEWQPIEGGINPLAGFNYTELNLKGAISPVSPEQRLIRAGNLTGSVNGWKIESDVKSRVIKASKAEDSIEVDFGN